jgi:hypothetical protein
MAETVLVTGGTGFVGGWCVVELLRRGYVVRTTVRSLSREAALRSSIAAAAGSSDRLTVLGADLTQDDGWGAAMAGCDYVLHVASPLGSEESGDPDAVIIPARDGTLRVLGAAAKARVRRVVMTSAATTATPPLESTRHSVSDETVWFDPDLHIRAMTAELAGGERFLAVGAFMWMADMSRTLRTELGTAASKVPTRTLPDFVLRLMARADRSLRPMTPRLGRAHRHTSAKAERMLGWRPRPATATLVECARSLMHPPTGCSVS